MEHSVRHVSRVLFAALLLAACATGPNNSAGTQAELRNFNAVPVMMTVGSEAQGSNKVVAAGGGLRLVTVPNRQNTQTNTFHVYPTAGGTEIAQIVCTVTPNAWIDGVINPSVAYQPNGTLSCVDW